MVTYPLIVSHHSSRSALYPTHPPFFYPRPSRAPKSHQIISFADPHSLTRLESYRSKNIGEGAFFPCHPERSEGSAFSLILCFVTSLLQSSERLIYVPKTTHRSSVPIPKLPRQHAD